MYFIHADASALLNYDQNVILGGMSGQNKDFRKIVSGKEIKQK
jgi:hypothetical protein